MSDAEYRTFLGDVCEAASVDSEAKAIGLIRAVLRTLSECLPGLLANELASDLPAPLASSLRREDWMEGVSLTTVEFARRVALREHSTPTIARSHIAVVNFALAKALPADMWRRLLTELPAEFSAHSSLLFDSRGNERLHVVRDPQACECAGGLEVD